MSKKIKTIGELKEELERNDSLQAEFKTNPLEAIGKFEITEPIYFSDIWVYRIVVGVLGLVILSIIVGVILIMIQKPTDIDKLVPTMLTATCSAAIGALTGLLAPSPRSKN
jgi:hypothetical protein